MASPSDAGKSPENLASLLARLYRERFTGGLTITQSPRERSFLFKDGLPIYAESNRTSGGLGSHLVSTGQLSEADQARLQEHVKAQGCKEGTALLALRLIEPRELMEVMRQQVHASLVECFAWSNAQLSLGGDPPPAEAQLLRPDVFALLLEGVATHWTVDQVLADLAPRMQQYPKANAEIARVRAQLGSDEIAQAYLHVLDGTRATWQAIQKATTPRALATAWVADALGAVDYHDAPIAEAEDGAASAPEIQIVVESSAAPASARPAKARPEAAPRAEAAKPAADSGELEQKIRRQFENLKQLNHYELLEVEADAEARAIKRAYLTAAKTYHPDALSRSGVSPEVREQASKVFAAIGKAHALLSDPKRRKEYDDDLGEGGGTLDADRLAGAEMQFRKGEFLMRSGNFKGAVEFLRTAVNMWPDEGAYQGALGWALFKKSPPENERACEHLQRAVELAPKVAEHWLHLSLALRATGDEASAEKTLAEAERLDPDIA